jgi:uncharacterized protein YdiU (UPF0061 family)
MRAKLGLFTEESDDAALAGALLTWMRDTRADFTSTFIQLGTPGATDTLTLTDDRFGAWHERWRSRLERQPQPAAEVTALMQRRNPVVIPRNHKVEEALAAGEHGNLDLLTQLLEALADPYDYSRARPELSDPPVSGRAAYRTFCGT